MTFKEELLRPFKGWVTVDTALNLGHRPLKFRIQGWTIILLAVILSSSFAVMFTYFTATPPVIPVRQAFLATTEMGGRLRIWQYMASNNEYVSTWSTENAPYTAATFGNVNNDGSTELVAITIHQSDEYHHLISLDLYAQSGASQWQQVGSFQDLPGGSAPKYPQNVALYINDVDGQPGNEVILMTPFYITIYQYSNEATTFQVIGMQEASAFNDDVQALFESMDIGDVDANGHSEIVLSVNTPTLDNNALIIIYQDVSFTEFTTFTIDAQLGTRGTLSYANHARSLRVGDLDGDGDLEICTVGYRSDVVPEDYNAWDDQGTGGRISVDIDDDPPVWPRDRPGIYYQNIVFISDHTGTRILEQNFGETFNYQEMIHLALGDLEENNVGDELILGCGTFQAGHVFIYALKGGQLQKLGKSYRSPHTDSSPIIYFISIADADGDEQNDIIISGRYQDPLGVYTDNVGTFYLEILAATGESMWTYRGGSSDEREVWYTTIG
ncbi:MAG: FG-GAP repeat domain-containing protein [Candidatus Thorarchaeota archaeon]